MAWGLKTYSEKPPPPPNSKMGNAIRFAKYAPPDMRPLPLDIKQHPLYRKLKSAKEERKEI